ncbi:MAG TPA: bifunctional folylpolyglutamate synthase/dihydrofolate synthase [Peptococcaceae bacterium]|nr:MAG: FolC bifunctional protein [Clostridia bacterium 41_269]HBT20388.1 bifunctional folylpolyglutamate synthase/dihydrofolate synthase [Peptococcaceae bacterium]
MNYFEAEKYLLNLDCFGIKPGLRRIKVLLNRLGNPHLNLRYVHIAGTNGKGSTAAMIAAVLNEAGYRVGLYTSPHIYSYRERISVNGKMVTKKEFAEILSLIKGVSEKLDEHPTEFETLTALALFYFNKRNVDIAVMEVGMGGRFDATNIIPLPEVSIITNISMDHTQYLGDNIERIAREKAGIVKRNGILVTAEESEKVREVFKRECSKRNALFLYVGDKIFFKKSRILTINGLFMQECLLKGRIFSMDDLLLSMIGGHQILNAATALLALEVLVEKGFFIKEIHIRRGFAKAKCKARVEILSGKPLVVLDAAHNNASIKMLKNILMEDLKVDKLVLVTGMLEDKDRLGAVKIWGKYPRAVIVTKPDSNRAGNWRVLGDYFHKYIKNVDICEEIEDAVFNGFKLAQKIKGCLCVAGSFYIIRNAERKLQKLLKNSQ